MKPTIGRIVHYVLAEHSGVHKKDSRYKGDPGVAGQIAPALVVAVWGETCVNLLVFLDGSNHGHDEVRHPDKPDGIEYKPAHMRWITSATLDESASPREGTWHWPPREAPDPRQATSISIGREQEKASADAERGMAAFDANQQKASADELPRREYTFQGASTKGPISTGGQHGSGSDNPVTGGTE